MKIRTDYVTNSSSSSFILARKGEFSEAQKEAVMHVVERMLIGNQLLTPESTEEEIQAYLNKDYGHNRKHEQKIREALNAGQTIFGSTVDFECWTGEEYIDILQTVWKELEKTGNGNFIGIDTELSY